MLTPQQIENLLPHHRALYAALAPADLALDVLSKKNSIMEVVELARITGLPLSTIYIRGQMSRVTSLLLTHSCARGVVVPTSTEGMLDKSGLNQCALVMCPLPQSPENPNGMATVGMHRDPVAVLDYASLYPSIMLHHKYVHSVVFNLRHDPSVIVWSSC